MNLDMRGGEPGHAGGMNLDIQGGELGHPGG